MERRVEAEEEARVRGVGEGREGVQPKSWREGGKESTDTNAQIISKKGEKSNLNDDQR